MVLLRPLRLLQRLDKPLSILLHRHTLCTKTGRGSSSLCSSLRGLNSTIQLRIDSYQPAQACPWKFHNPVYAIVEVTLGRSYFPPLDRCVTSRTNQGPPVNQRNAEELTNEKEGRDRSYWENPGWYSLWDSSEISLKQGPSSGR